MKQLLVAKYEESGLPQLKEDINRLPVDELVVLSSDPLQSQMNESDFQKLFITLECNVLLGASAFFPFNVSGVNLFYWKYYPRERGTYHYVKSGYLAATAADLIQYFEELETAYSTEKVKHALFHSEVKSSEVDVFHRYYLDVAFGLEKSALVQQLDREQKVFGITEGRCSVARWPIFSLRHGLIFYNHEKRRLGDKQIHKHPWDLSKKGGRVYNCRMNSVPAFVNPQDGRKAQLADFLVSTTAYVHSIWSIFKIWIFNTGKRKDHEIFRFRHNQTPEIKENIERLIGYLEAGQAFSFTHFNDGEMTFIQKYQAQDHKEVWFGSYFGRIQDKYNKQLGELLKAAFLKRQDYYFIGIPCQISHPKLSEYAKQLRPVDQFTIPAMTFHHNLSKYPRILGAIRSRKVYFVVNINQDVTFFSKMGLQFTEENIIRVPFRNAHEEYDTLKEHTFEAGAVVLLMSGMLAKILCAYWFEHHPNTTFIAFGSSFDDYIQSKINFNLYPADFPFSKTLIGSRSYLFGHKKHCDGCYDMTKPNLVK
ncbi:MAG: hypothetical protein AAF616_14030 [Bacteroidota bacterium]